MFLLVPCVVVSCHVVVCVVSCYGHEWVAIDGACVVSVLLHSLVYVGLEVVCHVNGAYVVVGVDGL